eukprot:25195_1
MAARKEKNNDNADDPVNEDIVNELIKLYQYERNDILSAMKQVVNKNDINAIVEYITQTQSMATQLINDIMISACDTQTKTEKTKPNADKTESKQNTTSNEPTPKKSKKNTKKESKENDRELQRFPIVVFVRMRPLVGLEISEKHESIQYNVKKLKKKKIQNLTLNKVYGRNNTRDKKYSGFKQILLPNDDNTQTFASCLLPNIEYLFKGDHCCVFAYGHTGSGKTHTIFGYKKENIPGMYQLFARNIFNDTRIKDTKDVFVEIRFTELYQGKVYDLLSSNKRECFAREGEDGVVHIRADPVVCEDGKIRSLPISHAHVQSEDELLEVISNGISSRNVGHSSLHDKSSRSHAFLEFEVVSTELMNERKKLIEAEATMLQIDLIINSEELDVIQRRYARRGMEIPPNKLKYLQMIDTLKNGPRMSLKDATKERDVIVENIKRLCNDGDKPWIGGTFVFVDLAGNEYGRDVKNKDVNEERERNEINKSLLALKECIRGLHDNKAHIVYRNSKLTMVLKRYLSGRDSRAIMIANIGSSQKYAKQTINTMQYTQLVAKA